MRNKSLLFLSVFILFYVYTHAQSQVYNLKGTVNAEYFSDGQWKRVTKETSLYENTFIKAKDKFEVSFKNGKKDGTRCCAKSEKGKKLKDRAIDVPVEFGKDFPLDMNEIKLLKNSLHKIINWKIKEEKLWV